MWAYALIATGLINWDYQRDSDGILIRSLLVIAPGLILLGSTFISPLATKLDTKLAQYFWGLIGVASLIYAFIN
jgi:hypothetical protein